MDARKFEKIFGLPFCIRFGVNSGDRRVFCEQLFYGLSDVFNGKPYTERDKSALVGRFPILSTLSVNREVSENELKAIADFYFQSSLDKRPQFDEIVYQIRHRRETLLNANQPVVISNDGTKEDPVYTKYWQARLPRLHMVSIALEGIAKDNCGGGHNYDRLPVQQRIDELKAIAFSSQGEAIEQKWNQHTNKIIPGLRAIVPDSVEFQQYPVNIDTAIAFLEWCYTNNLKDRADAAIQWVHHEYQQRYGQEVQDAVA